MIIHQTWSIDPLLVERLRLWDPNLDPNNLKFLREEHVTWNDGSLGCPVPGKYYTQALVEGWCIWLQYEDLILEIHTDRLRQHFAMPGVGYL